MKKTFKLDDMFKEIFKINLLYANPTVTSKMWKKDKYRLDPDKIYRDLGIKSYVFGSVMMLLIYSLIFMPIDYSMFPYIVDYSILLFIVMNIFQTFTYFFNVFYESKDIEGYMVLPIDQSTVFNAKMAVVSLATMQLAIPMVSIITLYLIRIGYPIILAILFALVDFLLLWGIIIVLNTLVMNGLSKTAVLTKFKTRIITAITVVTMILNVGFILIIQQFSNRLAEKTVFDKEIVYGPLTKMMSGYTMHILLIIITFIIVAILYKLSVSNMKKNFYSYVRKLQTNRPKSEKNKIRNIQSEVYSDNGDNKAALVDRNEFSEIDMHQNRIKNSKDVDKSVNNVETISSIGDITLSKGEKVEKNSFIKTMFKYNLSLINDSTVISQSILLTVMMPVLVLVPNMVNILKYGGSDFIYSNKLLFSIAISIAIGILSSVYSTGLPAIMISLDGENYNYIKSLPISERKYFLLKLVFSVGITAIFPTLLLIVGFIFFKVGILASIIGILSMLLLSFAIGSQWMIFDHKHIMTGWQNVSELYSRISRGWMMLIFFLSMMLVIFGVAVFMGIGAFGLENIASGIMVAFILILSIICFLRTKNYLSKL
ncbi:MAG: hypothetical protein RR561_06320 [Peptostreptococcus sp.]|uniref:hypothetical protein n=1 Tax=Peptostreptococcus sp. TaxID=1262 RepID=UPI002FC97D87